jgi:hypothetical protein
MASEKYIESQFYQAMGRFIAEWSSFEYVLANSFVKILRPPDRTKADALYRAFCSGRNFNTKRDLFDSTIESIADPVMQDFAKSVSRVAGRYSSFRNRVAHDLVIKKIDNDLIWYVISPHKNRTTDDPNAVTIAKLKAATKRVEMLTSLASAALLFRHKPEEVQPLVDGLPNEADHPLGVPIPPKKQKRVLIPRRKGTP